MLMWQRAYLIVGGLIYASNALAQTSLPANDPTLSLQDRVIAIGDIHGDYENFIALLKSTGLVNEKLDWAAGETTLVQLGDQTDRGPDSRKVIDLLRRLAKQAKRADGQVIVLNGNHEVMNITGDLRYVHPGEYAAFKSRNSKRYQQSYYRQTLKTLKKAATNDEPFVETDQFKREWSLQFPLGYVEHRYAWSPDGEYGKWALGNPLAVKINGTVFVHGGISLDYAALGIERINYTATKEIKDPELWGEGSIIDDADGPLWYRGWALRDETPETEAELNTTLNRLGAKRMVMGHTPLLNSVVSRFGGKVLIADVGLSGYYGGANAALELWGDEAYALINGQRLALPTNFKETIDYLMAARELVTDPAKIDVYIAELTKQPESAAMGSTQ